VILLYTATSTVFGKCIWLNLDCFCVFELEILK